MRPALTSHVGIQLFLAEALIARGDVSGGCAVFSPYYRPIPLNTAGWPVPPVKSPVLIQFIPAKHSRFWPHWLETGEITAGSEQSGRRPASTFHRSAEPSPIWNHALQRNPAMQAYPLPMPLACFQVRALPAVMGTLRTPQSGYCRPDFPFSSLPAAPGDAIQGNEIVRIEPGLGGHV